MGDIIVTKADTIPTKKVVEILGNVCAKKLVWVSEDPEGLFQELKVKARVLGADAVINAIYVPSGFGFSASATGVAVKLADENEKKCPKCKKALPEGKIAFCPYCGSSLS